MSNIYQIITKFFPDNIIRPHVYHSSLFIKDFAKMINDKNKKLSILDFGSGLSPYKNLFKNHNYQTYDKYDEKDAEINVVNDSDTEILHKDNSFDVIITTQVLEHLKEPSLIFNELNRILKKDGYLLLTTHQNFEVHGEPEDYYRYTYYGLEYLGIKNNLKIVNFSSTSGFFVELSYSLVSHLKRFSPKFYYYIIIFISPIYLLLILFSKLFDGNNKSIKVNPINMNFLYKKEN